MAVLNQMSVLDMIKEFRRNWRALCNYERTTLCGPDSMLLALQLSMAENNKRHNGEFTVSLSDVLLTWKYFLHEKLNLPTESVKVVDHYEDIKKAYDDFLKDSNMLDLIDVYQKCSNLTSNCENTISSSQLRDFLSGTQCAVNDETNSYIPASPVKCSQDGEQVRLLARKIFFSYLGLLVNSKNDLALSHVLNIPDRGLGREAFTVLKHAAREKQLSMFLMATSFIRTLELGGKGYAPSPSDPLRAHVKGLSNFINFIDKLDEILGDIPNPRSPTQVNNTSIKPLRERIHKSMQAEKIKMRQTLIRSQFACTYKDDYMTSKNRWNVNLPSKPLHALHLENDIAEGAQSSVGRAGIKTSSKNVHLERSKDAKIPRKSTESKVCQRKQVDLDSDSLHRDNGSEPSRHRNVPFPNVPDHSHTKAGGKLARAAKGSRCAARSKLIPGQTKLTQFFRL
ncbi:PCNA-interacting partner isoform X6 [Onychomys torridus]|uniref:PCNA-interacting partner isoform X6 n=1 Tax=Onychomys torridus TaxID=38674 RepID=UPI00167F80AD|nr:PCNA-interacting partner isoform X6 [Onychomys torridus]